MDIYFLRHASAGTDKLPGKADEAREIDDEGREQCRDVGRLLAKLGVAPDLWISSPLTRAIQTAELVGKELGFKPDEIVRHDALRPDASYEQFGELLDEYRRDGSMVVTGHNPTLSEFLSRLITRNSVAEAVDLKKGAVARVDSDEGMRLIWCITPKIARGS